jgi:hypothetical protein
MGKIVTLVSLSKWLDKQQRGLKRPPIITIAFPNLLKYKNRLNLDYVRCKV